MKIGKRKLQLLYKLKCRAIIIFRDDGHSNVFNAKQKERKNKYKGGVKWNDVKVSDELPHIILKY